MTNKIVVLPSGAELEIQVSPFRESKALQMALAEELKSIQMDPKTELTDINFWKNLFCSGISSQKIEEKLWVCMQRCTYNKLKITADTFEPVEAREDYLIACFEVMQENVRPFMKSLFARYLDLFQKLESVLASRPPKMTSSSK